jgi:hypothetical protein
VLPPVSVLLHGQEAGVTKYRSPTVRAQVEAEHLRLDVHRASAEGYCVVCHEAAPCRDANEAAEFLAQRGLLMPLSEPHQGVLLTYAWKLLFGLLDRRRSVR